MYSLFKVPWKFEKSYFPPRPLQIIPKQALKQEKRFKGKRDMKDWSSTRRDEPAVLGENQTEESQSNRNVFLSEFLSC